MFIVENNIGVNTTADLQYDCITFYDFYLCVYDKLAAKYMHLSWFSFRVFLGGNVEEL